MDDALDGPVATRPTPDDYKNITYAVDGDICRITLKRPEANNALNLAMLEELGYAFEQTELNDDIQVVLLQGNDKAFSSGLDVAEHTEEMVFQLIETFHRLFHRMTALQAVTVSVVKGMALGAGCELAACCDFCFAAEEAKLGQPEIKAGLFPSVGVVAYPRLIGLHKTYELILTGRIYSAKEAEQIGLITRALPTQTLEGESTKWIEFLRSFSTPVVQLARQAISEAASMPFEKALRHVEGIYLNQLMYTEDAKEGVKALLERRQPQWKNK